MPHTPLAMLVSLAEVSFLRRGYRHSQRLSGKPEGCPSAESGRLEAAGTGVGQGSLFELHVGVQVNLSSLGGFMAEPKSDHTQIHAAVEHGHGCAVSKGVWRDCFGNQ